MLNMKRTQAQMDNMNEPEYKSTTHLNMYKKLFNYENGNVEVSILQDGTKIRNFNGDAKPLYPESIDLKITNQCSLEDYCSWCHEASKKDGVHGDILSLGWMLEQLPNGVELAIGGGNPLQHPDLKSFLSLCKKNNIIPNLTVNEMHLAKYKDLLTSLIQDKLIYGLGISYSGKHPKMLEYFSKLTNNLVFHVIMGVNKLSCLDDIKKYSDKVLILGYKQFRKGKDFYTKIVEDNKDQWKMRLPIFFKKMILSFDNLAINQLELKKWFTPKSWETFYMGDDGKFTMYIDGVEGKFARSSTSNERFSLDKDVKKMFSIV